MTDISIGLFIVVSVVKEALAVALDHAIQRPASKNLPDPKQIPATEITDLVTLFWSS